MNTDNILEAVEQLLLLRQLSPIEQLILRHSWMGKSYEEMSQGTNYSSNYLKVIGFDLWNDISSVLKRKVTKKNIHLLLPQYIQTNLQQVPETKTETTCFTTIPRYNLVVDNHVEFPNSSLLASSFFYISRPPVEELACTEITKPGCVIRIKAPQKMGKNSLINQIVQTANANKYETAYLDFQEPDKAIFTNLDKFLRWFCSHISRQLSLNPKLDDYWDEDIGSKVSCKVYFQDYLLNHIKTPLVLILNEVNCVFEHPNIASEFLPMLRYWHEIARSQEIWQKLRLVIAHSTEIYVPLKLHQSPFNVGLALKLPNFNIQQVKLLASRYRLELVDSELEQLISMVGGHPYLINLAFYHLHKGQTNFPELLQNAPTLAGIYSDYLRRLFAIIQEQNELIFSLKQVLAADEGVFIDAIAAYKLESMGLIHLDGNLAYISCELYRLYFRKQLEEETLLTRSNIQRQTKINELSQFGSYDYFKQYLEKELCDWAHETLPLSLIWCDVDYFKSYSQSYGAGAANIALQRISSAICDCVKEQAALIARHKGEEFVIILPQTATDTAVTRAENIRASVENLAIVREQTEILTMSLGVATIELNSYLYPEMLIATAQQAMLQSKKLGRNKVTV